MLQIIVSGGKGSEQK